MKDLTNKDLNIIAKMKPSEFVEVYCGMRLFDYQKQLIDNYPKVTHYAHSRWNGKRIIHFHYWCNRLNEMKDNDIIVVWRGNNRTLMNKNEFANFLMTGYWL